jgi:uncharacterized membrane protein
MLAEPASSLTDLALAAAALLLALALRRRPPETVYWRRALEWTALAAFLGFVHHGWVRAEHLRAGAWDEVGWAIISVCIIMAISYLLAASVVEVLDAAHGFWFWVLRSGSLVAYVIVALLGHPGMQSLLLCEAVTMLAVLVLWGIALHRGHPRAWPVIIAILASGLAGAVKGILSGRQLPLGFDPNAVYHLAQIPGLVLLYLAVRGPERSPSGSAGAPPIPSRPVRRPSRV